MRNIPKGPFRARIPNQPRLIFIVAEGREIARIDVSYEDLDMDEAEWERRKLLSRLFALSPEMACLLDEMSQDERLPADRVQQINKILDKI